ncbi:unnamed protein product [Brachionus calyciflorus]|uniref:Uncharacterized protein n=1 Tax=Brachionus calyciflorus TaxID=104777 RepID=A0A813NY80_9BILA|nr:unnamed protein product [Brachionus calyciflorus]
MEYIEAPSIQEIDHKLTFKQIKWLSKTKFEDLLSKGKQIHPFISNENNRNRFYIGKTIQHDLEEGVRLNNYHYYYHDNNARENEQNELNLEIIGTIFLNPETKQWQLNVAHNSGVIEIKKNFLVLSIEDPNSYQWITTNENKIPKYALRGCVDRVSNEYFYFGRTGFDSENPKYYQNDWIAYEHPTKVPNLFGKVHVGHSLMYVPYDNKELAYTIYDVLCIKPSPSRLKNLCRLELRNLLSHSNERIERINQNESKIFLPECLISFIKYPSYLSVGEYMLNGEKIIRKDGKFEMTIERDGKFVCKSIIANRDKLSQKDLIDQEDTQFKRIIAYGVHSVWLSRFQIVLYKLNNKIKVIHNFYDKSPEYALTIDDSDTPNFTVRPMNQLNFF